ncbi:phage holin family protein [Mangrovihabitans endophyticus]|uniref:Membrane protein n=1 Tax=Mangrovihabitans endophyticus TaxID=1751298 RepID=A0A8J3FNZ3_9ACTN|nr:phage holin family protein [Mangrovihabitans endophyticus]GGK85462.1 membrane protein [Mangrovihabitans endophyticus]
MADVLNGGPARPVTDQSTSELVQRASEQITRLVRDEIALAKAELTEKGKHAGIGAGLFGGGGVLALYGVGALIATLIIVFNLFLPLWLAALIITVALFVVAGILALLGKQQVTRAVPPEPVEAVASVKADVDEVKHAVKGRSRE